MVYILDASLESKPRVQPSILKTLLEKYHNAHNITSASFLGMQKKQHVTRQQVI